MYANLLLLLAFLFLPAAALLAQDYIKKDPVYTECGYKVTTEVWYKDGYTTFKWTVVNTKPGDGSYGTYKDLKLWAQKLDPCVDPYSMQSGYWTYGTNSNLGSYPCIEGKTLNFSKGTYGSTPSYYTLVLKGRYSPVKVKAAFKIGYKVCCDYIWGVGCCKLDVRYEKKDVKCYGDANGAIYLSVYGAYGTPIYKWAAYDGGYVPSGQEYNKDLYGLKAGKYCVVIKDKYCEIKKCIEIKQPYKIDIRKYVKDVTCKGEKDGKIDITVSGGGGYYTYKWTTTNGYIPYGQEYNEDLYGIPGGTYCVTVKDKYGCQIYKCIEVKEPYELNLYVKGYDPNCEKANSGSITGTISGGTPPYKVTVDNFYTYQTVYTSGGSFTFDYLEAGTYTVKVKDYRDCKAYKDVYLKEPECEVHGCSQGFWKNHEERWDALTDDVVENMPSSLRFTTSTDFFDYFNVPTTHVDFEGTSLTMHEAISLGGGHCNNLARQGVAALLNAAQFGSGFPDGYSSFTALYNAIKAALTSGNCETLATALDDANNTDCPLGNGTITTTLSGNGTRSTVVNEIPAELKVTAHPNPFRSTINFNFVAPVSGKASLEVYDVLGRRLAIVYQGMVDAGTQKSVDYQVPAVHRIPIIYKLTVGNKTSYGKLLPGGVH